MVQTVSIQTISIILVVGISLTLTDSDAEEEEEKVVEKSELLKPKDIRVQRGTIWGQFFNDNLQK